MPQAPAYDDLRKKLYNIQVAVTPAVVPFGYLIGLVLGLTEDEALSAVWKIALPIGILAGSAGPAWMLPRAVQNALAERPSDKPGERLSRILELPRRIEIAGLIGSLFGVGLFAVLACALFHKPWMGALYATLVTFIFRLFVSVPQHIASERVLMDEAVAEFRRAPGVHPRQGGVLRPRLAWYLPYAFAVALIASVGTVLTIIFTKFSRAKDAALVEFVNRGDALLATELRHRIDAVVADMVWPLMVVGFFFVGVAMLIAWMFARRQQTGTRALEESIQVIAGGSSALPGWVATDELGDLAFGLGGIYEKLEAVAKTLQRSAERLSRSGEELTRSGQRQNDMVTRQAAALQEARVTAEEIRQTSALASKKSDEVLTHAEKAQAIRSAGEQAIDESLGGLEEIRAQVSDMAARIRVLGERAGQVASITNTVKDLADQSNMLALNAAIEAVRSGEHGKGFSVVAREIRTLADQSIQATGRVREILSDIGDAIRAAVQISEKGQARVEAAVGQMRTSGDRLRQLAEIVHQNLDAVRQISAAVSQQNMGIAQVSEAVGELSSMMTETIEALRSSEEATRLVQSVGEEVSAAMGRYSVELAETEEAVTRPAALPAV